MSTLHILSAIEQVAEHLRGELIRGTWRGSMPGGDRLASELGIRRSTIEGALQQLEKEGLLVGQGPRRRRLIGIPADQTSNSLRIGILLFENIDMGQDSIIEVRHRLAKAGYVAFYPNKTLCDLSMDVKRVARYVKTIDADAWVIASGSREVLDWFAKGPKPAFALFGRRHKVNIAGTGPLSQPSIVAITRRLSELGHQRIVMLSRKARRLPTPAVFERDFLGELEACGLRVGAYNLPEWEETKRGLNERLDSLFHLTAPTALIVHEPPQFIAVLSYLARRGIRVPEDVSMICTDPDRSFSWCEPAISHITWDVRLAAKRVVSWATKVSCGKDDQRQSHIKSKFVEGGSVGPAPTRARVISSGSQE